MKAREFAERHLLREERERIAEQMRRSGHAAGDVSRALQAARVSQHAVDEAVRTCRKRAELCSFITHRFAHEEWPEGVKETIGKRGVWLRELEAIARSEGLEVE